MESRRVGYSDNISNNIKLKNKIALVGYCTASACIVLSNLALKRGCVSLLREWQHFAERK